MLHEFTKILTAADPDEPHSSSIFFLLVLIFIIVAIIIDDMPIKPPPPPAEPYACPLCNTPAPDSAKFCSNCGAEFLQRKP